jgi:Spy/CpxP family protein refolding chaperone
MTTRRFGSRAALALVGVFLAGLFAGFAIGRWRSPTPAPEVAPAGLSASLDQLELTPDQRDRIETILTTSQTRTDRVLEEVLPPIRAIVDSVDGEIRRVLDEEQRIRLDQIRRRNVIIRREVIERD